MKSTHQMVVKKNQFLKVFIIILLFGFSTLFGNGITDVSVTNQPNSMIVTIHTTNIIPTEKVSGWIDRVNWLNLDMEDMIPPSNDILSNIVEYPLLEISSSFAETSTSMSFHLAKKISHFDFAFFPDTSMIQVLIFWGEDAKEPENGINESFIVPTKDEKKDENWKHPSSWKEERVRTYITILCDTPDLPIYVDGHYVGHTPIKHDVDVLPGWHKIGYFPGDPTQLSSPKSPKEKMIDDILRMGILDVFVDEGETEEVVLTYQLLEEDVYDYQNKVKSGTWVGFSMFFLLIVLLSWGLA